jgi:hypothetical protein
MSRTLYSPAHDVRVGASERSVLEQYSNDWFLIPLVAERFQNPFGTPKKGCEKWNVVL